MAFGNSGALSPQNADPRALQAPLDPCALRRAGNAILARLLVPGGFLLAGFYGMLVPLHLAVAPPDCARDFAAAAAVSALLYAVLATACWRWPPAPAWAHPLAALAALIVLANIALFMHHFPHPGSTAQVSILVLCAGLVLLSRLWLAVELVLSLAAWAGVAWSHPPTASWVEAGYFLVGLCGVSALVHEGRLRALARNESLRRIALVHRDEARAALERSEREFALRVRLAHEQRELDARVAEAQRVESLGVMAGGVAHDFNNVLAAVRGNAEWIDAYLEGAGRVAERARDIVAATRSASDLTRQMLAYAGRAVVATEVVDLSSLEETLRALSRAALPPTATFRSVCDPDVCVRGDRTQLQQILLNLVTNAGEALRDRGSKLAVRIRATELDAAALARCAVREGAVAGPFVEIEVSDDGPGIRSEVRNRVFDPFVSTKHAGRGLGLAAVQGIVRLHGGAASIESELGVGTTLRVYLPRVDRVAASPRVHAPRALADPATARVSSPPDPARGRCALVIDDDERVAKVCGRLLERIGYRVVIFTDPHRALREAALDDVSVALVDLAMGSMRGDQCVVGLRERCPELPVVLMSGVHHAEVAESLERVGGVVFLQKPYARQELADACERAVARAQPESASQSAPLPSDSPRPDGSSAIDSSISITGISSSIG